MDLDDRIRLLESEYFKLQDIIEAFDAKALQFKGWSVTVTLAAAAAALVSDKILDRQRMEVLALAGFGSLVFWLTEAMWKVFQQSFFTRLREIEAAFRDESHEALAPLQINAGWKRSFATERLSTFLKYATKPNTVLPHLAVTVLCIALLAYIAAFRIPFRLPNAAAATLGSAARRSATRRRRCRTG